ncbi:MAG: histidine phosphatase family protein [bacterium]
MSVDPADRSTYLVLIRHAQTDWNSQYRFQGHADTPLNEEGRAAIRPTVEALRGWAPAALYTSDLIRAREMAEAAAEELGGELESREGLRECSYGAWEGLTVGEIEEDHPGELEAWRADEEKVARGGGESLREMQDRSWAGLEAIADEHTGETVGVFTHSGPIRGAVCRIVDLSMAERYRFQVDNSSLTVIRRRPSGSWQLVLLNQTNHMRAPLSETPRVASRPEDG